jgi:hypothetical protein
MQLREEHIAHLKYITKENPKNPRFARLRLYDTKEILDLAVRFKVGEKIGPQPIASGSARRPGNVRPLFAFFVAETDTDWVR